ncbi:histone deacetylase 11 isoform X4 [Manacus candei]|nr:histone deacetylase 11 isoform X4 [Manacus candei]XP_051649256.1 histone deacetylase 11 isoform X4 [Manacus candei]
MAGKLAVDRGWAINVGGGFHHCSSDKGGGFCAYADITLAIKFLFERVPGVSKATIIDLDAHQGNGHERDFMDDPRVYIMDAYNRYIYPGDGFAKRAIKRKVELEWGTEDTEYLQKVHTHVEGALNEFKPDILVYNAGTDILDGDPLGGLAISPQVCVALPSWVGSLGSLAISQVCMALPSWVGSLGSLAISQVCMALPSWVGSLGSLAISQVCVALPSWVGIPWQPGHFPGLYGTAIPQPCSPHTLQAVWELKGSAPFALSQSISLLQAPEIQLLLFHPFIFLDFLPASKYFCPSSGCCSVIHLLSKMHWFEHPDSNQRDRHFHTSLDFSFPSLVGLFFPSHDPFCNVFLLSPAPSMYLTLNFLCSTPSCFKLPLWCLPAVTILCSLPVYS